MLDLGTHEFDLMLWLLDEDIATLSSVGNLRHFSAEKAPIPVYELPRRCADACPIEVECPFSAVGLYLERRYKDLPEKGYPYSTVANGDESPEVLVRVVETSHWGTCVYHQDSHVIDHQATVLQTVSGVSATLTISGHSMREGRSIRIDGSRASLVAELKGLESHITVYEHATQKENTINFRIGPGGLGGDNGLVDAVVKLVRDQRPILTEARDVANAHLLAFAAEEARVKERTLNYQGFQDRLFRAAEVL
ncbi:MAG: hypothetical protein HC915_02450 [Anaerolineae bacterium]|nr:hypothetical protein [Anaerolineae bacterium]